MDKRRGLNLPASSPILEDVSVLFFYHSPSCIMLPYAAPSPPDEPQRLQALLSYEILDTEPEAAFEDLVKLASQICEAPISLITLLDADRQWFKARVGMKSPELPREQAFCGYAIHDDQLMIVPDATADERFVENPLVTEDPHIRFYAGMPLITPEGYRLGALCVIDHQPRELTPAQEFALRTLGREVSAQLELRRKVKAYQEVLEKVEQQRQRLEALNHLHDRLLSVMAHDIRSPLANLAGYLAILKAEATDQPPSQTFIATLHDQVIKGTDLLDQLLHWASVRLMGERHTWAFANLHELVETELVRLSDEMAAKQNLGQNLVDPTHEINTEVDALRFVLRNLLSNANKFTDKGKITVNSEHKGDKLRLWVQDTGVGIPSEDLDNFKNERRRHSKSGTSGEKGFGVALILCQDFIQELGGELEIESEVGQGSTFGFALPIV